MPKTLRERITAGGWLLRLFLVAFTVLCILPFYYVAMVAISDPLNVQQGRIILFPRGLSLAAFESVLGHRAFFNAFVVSVSRTVLGVSIGLAVQASLAYALSRPIRGRRFLTLALIFALIFNGGMIPTYLVVRGTGLMDTIWALVIPQALDVFNAIILISFFRSTPESIIESAKIEGAGDITIFIRLVIPLSLPAIATISLFIAVDHWNELMDSVLYINRDRLWPLQRYLLTVVRSNEGDTLDSLLDDSNQFLPSLSLQAAAIFAATVPILVVYPFIQRYFIKGIMLGAIKG